MAITAAIWKATVSSGFNQKANWSTDAIPNANSIAELTASGSAYTVTSSVNNTVNEIWTAANATLSIAADIFSVTGYIDNLGAIDVAAGASLDLGNSTNGAAVTNTGALDLNGGASAATEAEIDVKGSWVNLDGGGTLTLSNSAFNEIIGGTSSAQVQVTNDWNTIAGAGAIGDKYMQFINGQKGIVDADDSTRLMINGALGAIAAGAPADENDGVIEATGAGGLRIDSDMYNNGQLLAEGTGALILGADSVSAEPSIDGGGELAATKSGAKIDLNDTAVTLSFISTVAGSSIVSLADTADWLSSGDLTNAGSILVGAGSTLNLNASVQNTGTISLLGSASAISQLLIYGSGAQVLGGGKIVLSNSVNNFIGTSEPNLSSGAQFTNNQGVLIEGAGSIGDANLRFANLGTVDSDDSAGMTLVGDTNSNLKSAYNDGLIENTGSGMLVVENTWSNAGTIEERSTSGALELLNFTNSGGGGYFDDAVSGGVIDLNNVNLSSSTLETVADSTVDVNSTSTIDDQVLNHGSIDINNTTLLANSLYYNYGTIELAGSSAASKLELNGGLDLRDGGDLILGNTVGNSIVSNGSAQNLNNYDNTISGTGTIGDSNMSFENDLDGTVDANGTGALTLKATASSMFNGGLMESTGAGGLTVNGNLVNSGVLEATAGVLDVTGDVSADGQVEIGGTGTVQLSGEFSQNVTFQSATAHLILGDSSSASGIPSEIYGIANGDTIDLRDVQDIAGTTKAMSSSLNESTLTVSDGTHTANLYLFGSYSAGSFKLSSDNHGGTLVTMT